MSKVIKGKLPGPADEVYEKLKGMCTQFGIDFNGDVCNGEAEGKGFHLKYDIEGEDVTIEVLKKPTLVPWAMLEKQIKQYL